jgi:tetratricopeptide (TPR) repeat protein
MKLKLASKAIENFTLSLKEERGSSKVLLKRAKCLMSVGRYKESEIDFEEAIKVNYKNSKAYTGYAKLLWKISNKQASKKALGVIQE